VVKSVGGVAGALLAALVLGACGSSSGAKADAVTTSDPPPAATTVAPTQTPALDLHARGAAAAAVVREFYGAVNAHRFAAAWQRLSPGVQRQFGSLERWRAGYSDTRSTSLSSGVGTASDASHATVDVRLHSVDVDACGRSVTQRFAGTWSLHRVGGRWQATKLSIAKTGGGTLRSASECSSSSPTASDEHGASSLGRSQDSGSADGTGTGRGDERVCYPAIKLDAVRLPAVHLPAVHLPAVTVGNQDLPAQTIPAQTLPAQTIPAQTIPGGCYDAPKSFAIANTTVRTTNYTALDPGYSRTLSTKYWTSTPNVSVPDATAAGFGELNGAGFPKNQYVRPYVRRDGTFVHGYWRNSPSDGLPTCRVISC
jgi:hypothetical protein